MDDIVRSDPLAISLPIEFAQIVQPVDITQLNSYEDHIAAAIEQQAKRDSSSWGLADVINSLTFKFGEQSQTTFASQLNISRSTITNYLRTARAFPPAKRLPDVSFTHHMIASFADGYNGKKFSSETRFHWVEVVADQKLRTKHLQNKIKQEKEKVEAHAEYSACYMCGLRDINVLEVVILVRDPNSSNRTSDQYMMHQACYDTVKTLIEEKAKNG